MPPHPPSLLCLCKFDVHVTPLLKILATGLNCDVLSSGDLSHKSHFLSTECPCVHESDSSVHNTTECTLAHVQVTGFPYVVLQVLLVVCGIWSLDFFHSVIPPFCVSNNIRNVHALALEYVVAFYLVCLVLITYVCIKTP